MSYRTTCPKLIDRIFDYYKDYIAPNFKVANELFKLRESAKKLTKKDADKVQKDT